MSQNQGMLNSVHDSFVFIHHLHPFRLTVHYARPSLVKQFERRVVSVWKLMTKKGRKPPRNSFIARDFVPVTNHRRSAYRQHFTH